MKQALMTGPQNIIYREVPVPEVGPEQIEINIKTIGVCGSDIHVWYGKHPYTQYPVVQGHEVAAVVTKVGSKVRDFAPGDAVTIQPQVVCGKCYPCKHGLYNDCETLKVMGFQTTGMASEFFVTDAVKAVKLPEGISMEHGAMIEPLAVACHAVRRFGTIEGRNVVVIGGGPIGNLVAQTAKAKGAVGVLMSEISQERLAIGRACGLRVQTPREKDLKDAILEEFGTDGADVMFECIGNPDTLKQAVDIARKGSDIIVVGVVPDLCKLNMGFVQDHELRLIGSAMYRTEDFREAISLVEKGLIELNALITHRVPFSDYASAYRLIEENKDSVMKVIIDMDK